MTGWSTKLIIPRVRATDPVGPTPRSPLDGNGRNSICGGELGSYVDRDIIAMTNFLLCFHLDQGSGGLVFPAGLRGLFGCAIGLVLLADHLEDALLVV